MQTTDLVVSLQCKKLWNIKAPAKLFVILTAQCMWWLENFISHSWMNCFMQIHHKLWSLFVNNEIKTLQTLLAFYYLLSWVIPLCLFLTLFSAKSRERMIQESESTIHDLLSMKIIFNLFLALCHTAWLF